MRECIEKLIAKIKSVGPTYLRDGVLHCAECNTPVQCRITIFGESRLVPCVCQCRIEAQEALDREQRRMESELEIPHLLAAGIRDKNILGCCFEKADDAPVIRRAKRYAEEWDRARRDNIGLLLTGDVGTGKTFAAACIANHLIGQRIPVMMTSIPRIMAELSGTWEKAEFLDDLCRYDLLVLDDLGVERSTEYAAEQAFAVIDARYRLGKPLVVTTNLSMEELKNPPKLELKRIYDRVLEMCVPVLADGESRRVAARKVKRGIAREMLR